MEKLINLVEEWSKNEGLDKNNPIIRYLKVSKKCSEIAAGLSINDRLSIENAIGDTMVNLIILSQQLGLTLEECLQTSYDEIKEHTENKVNVVFVESEDLIEVGDIVFIKEDQYKEKIVCIKEYKYKEKQGEVIWIDEVGLLHVLYGENDVLVLNKDSVKKIK